MNIGLVINHLLTTKKKRGNMKKVKIIKISLTILALLMFGGHTQEFYEQNYLVSNSNTDILNSVIVDSIDNLGELATNWYEWGFRLWEEN